MKQIHYKVIPNDKQRYPTVGDYWRTPQVPKESDSYQIRVSDMKNDDYHILVLIHELIELHLVLKRGIKIEDIDAFDKQFEEQRALGLHTEDAEPGDHRDAPYRREHLFATNIERLIAYELGVDWEEYGKTVSEL